MRQLRTIRRGTLLAVVATLVSLTACSGGGPGSSAPVAPGDVVGVGADAAAPKHVSVGVIPIVDVAPLYLGVAKGFFSKRGLDVTLHPAQGGAAIVPAVLAGKDHFGFSNVVSLMTARDKGVPLIVIGAGSSSTADPQQDVNAVLVGKTSTFKSAKDLAGRRVAINSLNNIGDTTVRTAVQKAGGDPATVKFVEMPFPDMPAQLAAGKVDAVWESEPFRSQVLAQGGRILFDNLTETYSKVQIATYFTSEQLKRKDPGLVAAFTAGLNESLDYASGHPDEARAILGSYTAITPDVAATIVLPTWPTVLDLNSARTVGAAARKFGILKKDADLAGLYGTAG